MADPVSDHLARTLKRIAGVTDMLGLQAEGSGYRGRVAVVCCVLPTRKSNKVRACLARALKEAFTERRDRAVVAASDRLDPGHPDGYVDAAQILRERGYTDLHVWRLAGEFGKDLQLLARGKVVRTVAGASYGPCDKDVTLWHRVDDSRLIESALASFRERELHARVLADLPDPVAERLKRRLDEQGRGRKRLRPSIGESSGAIGKSDQ